MRAAAVLLLLPPLLVQAAPRVATQAQHREPKQRETISAKAGLEALRKIAREPNGMKPTADGKSCHVHDEITSKVVVETKQDRKHASKMLDLLVKRVKRKSKDGEAPTWIGIHAARPLAQKLGQQRKLLGAGRKAIRNHMRAALKARKNDPSKMREQIMRALRVADHAGPEMGPALMSDVNRWLTKIGGKLGQSYNAASEPEGAWKQVEAW